MVAVGFLAFFGFLALFLAVVDRGPGEERSPTKVVVGDAEFETKMSRSSRRVFSVLAGIIQLVAALIVGHLVQQDHQQQQQQQQQQAGAQASADLADMQDLMAIGGTVEQEIYDHTPQGGNPRSIPFNEVRSFASLSREYQIIPASDYSSTGDFTLVNTQMHYKGCVTVDDSVPPSPSPGSLQQITGSMPDVNLGACNG